MRRGKALHAPAFLIHQHQDLAAGRLARLRDEARDLLRGLDIAREQDDAGGLGRGKKFGLAERERGAG